MSMDASVAAALALATTLLTVVTVAAASTPRHPASSRTADQKAR
jgi:hypothetical protein